MIDKHKNASLWSDRLSFIWYNDDAIFRYTNGDFDALAKSYADSGINVVITFSCTHFRYSFFDWWDRILSALSRLTRACHKYGIRVVEHSSTTLTHNPQNEAEEKRLAAELEEDASNVSSWRGLIEDSKNDGKLLNTSHPVSSFRQIDGRTGRWTRSNYRGYSFCVNNPYFRESYFKYLEEVYKTGVDGIMCDDLQFWADGNSCACEHCRRLFKEETGFELPYPEHWKEFFGNYGDEKYVAWKKFKIDSGARFQRDVNRHFTSLGYKMLRPNYGVPPMYDNWSCYPLESCRELWDYVFQENCRASVIRCSYMFFATEAMERYAMTICEGKPSFSLFYPERQDTYYLSWALAHTWGQGLIATFGSEKVFDESKYRSFEKIHADLYTMPVKDADVAFYLSQKTRDFTASRASMLSMCSLLQGAYASGYTVDIVFDDDPYETLCKKKAVAAAGCVMMSDGELESLARYVSEGGRLFVFGEFASLRPDGSKRSFSEAAGVFGESLSKITFFPDFSSGSFLPTLNIDRLSSAHKAALYRYDKNATKKLGGFFELCGIQKSAYHDLEDGELLLGFFKNDGFYTVNVTNVTGLIPEKDAPVSHDDICESFTENAKKLPAFSVFAKCPGASSVTLYSPEMPEEGKDLPFTLEDGYVRADIPEGAFSGYAVIKIE